MLCRMPASKKIYELKSKFSGPIILWNECSYFYLNRDAYQFLIPAFPFLFSFSTSFFLSPHLPCFHSIRGNNIQIIDLVHGLNRPLLHLLHSSLPLSIVKSLVLIPGSSISVYFFWFVFRFAWYHERIILTKFSH